MLHDNEIPIDPGLVRRLVDTQFPQFAGLPIQRLGESGSSNQLYRLGDDLLVRLPRQPGGGVAINKELRWRSMVAGNLPVTVPETVGLGQPASGYPEPWSIVKWIEGELPQACGVDEPSTDARIALAVDLADVILALRAVPVSDAARADSALRGYRGRSLAEVNDYTLHNLQACRSIAVLDLDLDAALDLWTQALTLPGANEVGAQHWYHGDLVAENLLLARGKLCAVLDFGGLAIGDPTVDLHGAWELLDPISRDVFRARLGVDEAQWLRGRAWALAIALGVFPYYWGKMPQRIRDRLAMAQAVLADAVHE